jgi:hypothetical protein
MHQSGVLTLTDELLTFFPMPVWPYEVVQIRLEDVQIVGHEGALCGHSAFIATEREKVQLDIKATQTT